MIIPKDHFCNFTQASNDVLSDVVKVAHQVAVAVTKATGCEDYNILCNNGRDAGQLVDHIHFHIIPRVKGDGVLKGWPAGGYEQGQAEKIADKIKEYI